MSFLYQHNGNFLQQLGTDDITLAFSPDQIITLSACAAFVIKTHGAGNLQVAELRFSVPNACVFLCSYMSAWGFGAARVTSKSCCQGNYGELTVCFVFSFLQICPVSHDRRWWHKWGNRLQLFIVPCLSFMTCRHDRTVISSALIILRLWK